MFCAPPRLIPLCKSLCLKPAGQAIGVRSVVKSAIRQGFNALDLAFTDEHIDQFTRYLSILARWNQAYNLTAIREPERMVTHHLLDSLAILPFCQGERLMDLGSGAGLPGVPIAMMRPAWSVRLVDSNGKKTRFLDYVTRQLDLTSVVVERSRGEDVSGRFDTITARAFGNLSQIAKICAPRLAENGRIVAMKSEIEDEETRAVVLSDTGLVITDTVTLSVPGVAGVRSVVLLSRSD